MRIGRAVMAETVLGGVGFGDCWSWSLMSCFQDDGHNHNIILQQKPKVLAISIQIGIKFGMHVEVICID